MKIVFWVGTLFFAGSASADLAWKFRSEVGDSIGQGQNRTVVFTNAQFTASVVTGGIQVSAFNGVDRFSVELTGRNAIDSALAPNFCYERAQRSPFRMPGRPGVDVSMNGRGCNDSMGRFRIRELIISAGVVTAASLDVAQHCSKNGGPALFSNIRINTSTSTETPFIEPVYDASGSLTFSTIGTGVGSSAPGGSAVITLDRLRIDAQRNFDNGVSFFYRGPLPPNIASGNWDLDFAAPGDAPIAVGSYPTATRYPFQAASAAGLAFSYNGSGSNMLTGSFNVTAVANEPLDALPASFDASFVQNSEANPANRTNGQISYTAQFRNGQQVPTAILKTGFEENETQPTESSLAYPCLAN
jgi:hypothetical protein